MRRIGPAIFLSSLCMILLTKTANAQGADFSRFGVEVEGGPFWISRNDVRIPPEGGTQFSLLDLTGKGPKAYFRIYANLNLARKHGLRFLAAPIRSTGTGTFSEPVFFVDETFAPNTET